MKVKVGGKIPTLSSRFRDFVKMCLQTHVRGEALGSIQRDEAAGCTSLSRTYARRTPVRSRAHRTRLMEPLEPHKGEEAIALDRTGFSGGPLTEFYILASFCFAVLVSIFKVKCDGEEKRASFSPAQCARLSLCQLCHHSSSLPHFTIIM